MFFDIDFLNKKKEQQEQASIDLLKSSALYFCSELNQIINNDIDIAIHIHYHTFLHGEEGDSDMTLKDNANGSIQFSIYDYKNIFKNKSNEQYKLDLKLINIMNNISLIDYVNTIAIEKFDLKSNIFKREQFE